MLLPEYLKRLKKGLAVVKKKVVKKKSSSKSPAFEESLGELERVVTELEGGDLGLSEALACYEQGVKHLASCNAQLEQAERKIELLSGVDANGNPITESFETESFDVAAESLDQKAAARGKRRSRPARPGSQAQKVDNAEVGDEGCLF